ncbi:MAG: hypothetical protein ABI598_02395 [Chloroflexota bacterium]
MQSQAGQVRPEDLKPMPYGRAKLKDIKDEFFEPIWGGRRGLVDVFGDDIGVRDEQGVPVEGYDALRADIRASVTADEAVLDGYLLPAPLRDTIGAEISVGLKSVPTASQMGRHMLMGSVGVERKDNLDAAAMRDVPVEPSMPTAFVAIDLLWLDGQPLIDVPLAERKRLLDAVVRDSELVRRTVAVRAPASAWYGQWRAFGFIEMAIKGANSRYTPGMPNGQWATMLIPKR